MVILWKYQLPPLSYKNVKCLTQDLPHNGSVLCSARNQTEGLKYERQVLSTTEPHPKLPQEVNWYYSPFLFTYLDAFFFPCIFTSFFFSFLELTIDCFV